jgi:hypothetical protein
LGVAQVKVIINHKNILTPEQVTKYNELRGYLGEATGHKENNNQNNTQDNTQNKIHNHW